jgi:hypothetical protein
MKLNQLRNGRGEKERGGICVKGMVRNGLDMASSV